MKIPRSTTTLLAGSAAVALAAALLAACRDPKDACLIYSDDRYARYIGCSTPVPASTWDDTAPCTDDRIKLANCLDDCLSKIDCDCVHDPSLSGCTDKMKPYHDCESACSTPP
jgi:hypothetical protein